MLAFSDLEKSAGVELTYDIINKSYELFLHLKSDHDDSVFEDFIKTSLPIISSVIKTVSINRGILLKDFDNDELRQQLLVDLISLINSTNVFPSSNAYYVYLKKKFSGTVNEFITDNLKMGIDLDDESSNIADESTDDDISSYIGEILSVLEKFLAFSKKNEREAILYIARSILDPGVKSSPFIIFQKFSIRRSFYNILLKRAHFLLKLSYLVQQEYLTLREVYKIRGDHVKIDKLYLSLMLLDNYRYLPDLLFVFGDKLPYLLKVLGGKSVSLPDENEIKDVSRKIDIFMAVEEDGSEDNINFLSKKYNMSKKDILDLHLFISNKLRNLIKK
jgi:hypothetical protein